MTKNLVNACEPFVVALFPRESDAFEISVPAVIERTRPSLCCALCGSQEESDRLRSLWPFQDEMPLLIIRTDPDDRLRDTLDVIECSCGVDRMQPLAVLIIDSTQKKEEILWRDNLARQLKKRFVDIQLLEYSPSWLQSPPRIR
ncbi:MAG: hypothetical protein JST40_11325 [Armatimonadetes bacterium]|nr:hypothetical protein [Armatimonadota bacterium]